MAANSSQEMASTTTTLTYADLEQRLQNFQASAGLTLTHHKARVNNLTARLAASDEHTSALERQLESQAIEIARLQRISMGAVETKSRLEKAQMEVRLLRDDLSSCGAQLDRAQQELQREQARKRNVEEVRDEQRAEIARLELGEPSRRQREELGERIRQLEQDKEEQAGEIARLRNEQLVKHVRQLDQARELRLLKEEREAMRKEMEVLRKGRKDSAKGSPKAGEWEEKARA